jgi:hypothetical protein
LEEQEEILKPVLGSYKRLCFMKLYLLVHTESRALLAVFHSLLMGMCDRYGDRNHYFTIGSQPSRCHENPRAIQNWFNIAAAILSLNLRPATDFLP